MSLMMMCNWLQNVFFAPEGGLLHLLFSVCFPWVAWVVSWVCVEHLSKTIQIANRLIWNNWMKNRLHLLTPRFWIVVSYWCVGHPRVPYLPHSFRYVKGLNMIWTCQSQCTQGHIAVLLEVLRQCHRHVKSTFPFMGMTWRTTILLGLKNTIVTAK